MLIFLFTTQQCRLFLCPKKCDTFSSESILGSKCLVSHVIHFARSSERCRDPTGCLFAEHCQQMCLHCMQKAT